jgi:Signal transduction histidine kinase
VGNTLSKLYEIESDQSLFSAESAQQYFDSFDSIVPEIKTNLDSLKQLATDSSRVTKLDTIKLLIDRKRVNLREVAVLLDSIRRAPRITRQTESSYVPKELNKEISDFLESKNFNTPSVNESDTSVVRGERRGFLDRVRNVFVDRPDSTIVIQSKSIIPESDFKLIVDTIINKVRYSERLDLERQKQFQNALIERREVMSYTNRMLTARIDDLLKGIEQEEMRKSLQLLMDKEQALSDSQSTMHLVSLLAVLIAVVFGILFLADINRSQRYRRQLEASNKRISELLASREKLMLTISHDIKAPVSSILGYIELMGGNVDKAKSGMYLDSMKNSGEHVMQLVSTLLDYHKLEAGTWQLKEFNINLQSLVNETASSFRPLAAQKELEYSIDNRLPEGLTTFGDPYVIRQIMSNIISNAIKYTPQGKISVLTEVEVRESANWLIFSVSDTGTGIRMEDQQIIFQEFRQLENDGIGVHIEGSGLGLAITKGLVDKLQGTIRLDSEKEKGSEFIVELPLKPEQKEHGLAVDEPEKEYDLEGISVLVVDDDPVQLTMTSEMLEIKKINSVTEANPENVLSLLKHTAFDILFVDLQMPQTNGFVLVEKIRKLNVRQIKDLPIIALSARSDMSKTDVQASGFTDLLAKPFTSPQLYDVIYRYVRGKNSDTSYSAGKQQPASEKGARALIEFVKEDSIASARILHSFIHETTDNIAQLEDAFVRKDHQAAEKISHKMLPLFRMMGDESLIAFMEQLEEKRSLSAEGQEFVLNKLKKGVEEAKALKREIDNDRNDA